LVLLTPLTIGVVLAQGSSLLGGKLLTGSDVTIAAGQTVDHDIYVFSGTLTSNGTIDGDVVAFGGSVFVNGPVKGDILAAGGQVFVGGAVTGDVRAAGGQVTITDDVTEDVLVAGGQVALGGRVGQDLLVSSGRLTLTGSVAGSAIGNVGAYTKSGSVAGTDSITITSNQSAPLGPPRSNPVLDALRHLLTVLVVALLALWLAPQALDAAEAQVRERPVHAFAWGIGVLTGYVVVVIVIAVLVILLAIALGLLGFDALLGIDLFGGFIAISAITLVFVVAAAFVADLIVGLALARAVARQAGRSAGTSSASPSQERDRWSDLGPIAGGVVAVVIVTSLPIIGPLAKFLVVLFGLGALALAWRGSRLISPATPLPASAPPPGPATTGA
jgi:hypothetical protein